MLNPPTVLMFESYGDVVAPLIDQRMALAVSAHAQPGLFALLLGSGLSSAAGIPTGWGVLTNLTTRVAALKTGTEAAVEQAQADPEKWWAENVSDTVPLTYSKILEELGNSRASRAAIVTEFFEPTEDDLGNGLKQPTRAHRAIADLVVRGTVKVIVTTNFDHLLERALSDVGVTPVVLSTPSQWDGAAPLVHSACTVIKVHGDYRDLDQRNTADELAVYEESLRALLSIVFNDYGLIVSGWSGDSDTALREAIEAAVARRYATYFATYGTPSPTTAALIATRGAIPLENVGADELFTGLRDNLAALDDLAEPPLSTAVKVQRLKRDLLNPQARIQVHDRVHAELRKLVEYQRSLQMDRFTGLTRNEAEMAAALAAELDKTAGAAAPLLTLLATGVYHDRDATHLPLWLDVISRLMSLRSGRSTGSWSDWSESLRHVPALLALRVAGTAAVLAEDDAQLLDLMLKPKWRTTLAGEPAQFSAVDALYEWSAFNSDSDVMRCVAKLKRTSGRWPVSGLLRILVRPIFAELEQDPDRWVEACNRFEYRQAVIAITTAGVLRTASGLCADELTWMRAKDEFGPTEQEFSDSADVSLWLKRLSVDESTLRSKRIELHGFLHASSSPHRR